MVEMFARHTLSYAAKGVRVLTVDFRAMRMAVVALQPEAVR
jgi:hypothetical protein